MLPKITASVNYNRDSNTIEIHSDFCLEGLVEDISIFVHNAVNQPPLDTFDSGGESAFDSKRNVEYDH